MSDPAIRRGSTALEEAPDSPVIECGEKVTVTRIYSGAYALCDASRLYRNTIGTGNMAGFMVSSSKVQSFKPGMATLTIVWEASGAGSGATLPRDEISVEPFEIKPPVEMHPKFNSLTDDQRETIRTAVKGSTAPLRDQSTTTLGQDTAEAVQLLRLLKKGVETFYLAGIRYSWTVYSWTLPACTSGGFIQSPGGPLADYLPSSFQFLRFSDQCSWDGFKWKLTSVWVGAPAGHWDTYLYS